MRLLIGLSEAKAIIIFTSQPPPHHPTTTTPPWTNLSFAITQLKVKRFLQNFKLELVKTKANEKSKQTATKGKAKAKHAENIECI